MKFGKWIKWYYDCKAPKGIVKILTVAGKERIGTAEHFAWNKTGFASDIQAYQEIATETEIDSVRSRHVGASDYSEKKIQPWDIWLEYDLNPWDADIVKRVLRTKAGESRTTEYEKIIHICQERIRQLKEQQEQPV